MHGNPSRLSRVPECTDPRVEPEDDDKGPIVPRLGLILMHMGPERAIALSIVLIAMARSGRAMPNEAQTSTRSDQKPLWRARTAESLGMTPERHRFMNGWWML